MSTKSQFIASLAETLSITKKAAGEVYSAVSNITMASLADNSKAILPGIGRIKLKAKAARMGRNPKTGEQVPISERNVFKLAPSKLAKARINIK